MNSIGVSNEQLQIQLINTIQQMPSKEVIEVLCWSHDIKTPKIGEELVSSLLSGDFKKLTLFYLYDAIENEEIKEKYREIANSKEIDIHL